MADVMGLNKRFHQYMQTPVNPHDRALISPVDGMFIYTQKNKGKTTLPVCVGLEYLLGIEMFSKAVKRNASIGSVFQTENYKFPIAMIAVGSLNVNRIYADYEERKVYKKETPCGYFSIGSCLLLCFPDYLEILVEEGSKVKIGDRILI